jgi:hypothetical protein
MPELPDPPPGCLAVLVRLSADTATEVTTARGESPAFVLARQLSDDLLEYLTANYASGPLDVAVLGYRTSETGAPELFSLLPDGDAKPRFVPLSQVAQMPAVPRAADDQPKKWTVTPPPDGAPCAAAALAKVYQMVAVWLTGRFAARPPVVLHCTGPDGLDEPYFRAARSLNLLSTACGPARLMHYLFAPGEPDAAVRELLRETGAELPANPDTDRPARRALFVNEWDLLDQYDALFAFAPGEGAAPRGPGAIARHRAMWAEKMGNTPEQWEDAHATDAPNGVAAIADGASSGIYCRTWADQLCRAFLSARPDTRDPVILNKWVNGLRTEWRAAINYATLNWSKQAKVDQVGAAATLLGLEIGAPGTTGTRAWRACAVGDASLFHVRGGKLLATFPVTADDQFGSAPLLVRSSPGFRTTALAAEGTCAAGDRFVLATDAVAARLFKSIAQGAEPDWDRFETIDEDDWRAELDALRRANDMVNDDCTLVVLVVAGTAAATIADMDPLPELEPAAEPEPAPAHAPDAGADSNSDPQPEPPPADDPPAATEGGTEPTDPRV